MSYKCYNNAIFKDEEIVVCSFDMAQNAYLTLKFKRNRIAHDYMNGLTNLPT